MPEANGLHWERLARPQQPQQPMPEAIEHDDDYFWSVHDKLELENILTSLVDPLSRGNEEGQEEVITLTCQVFAAFPYQSSTVQQYIASITECDNSMATQKTLRPMADHFQALFTSILG